ncbi:MAG: twin-arginine translocase TatA/TatE family subunit [Limnochordales bacterium]|nr:twin-arginine translocase TatA/TatE family subunit [Limnochordales bacterium]
MFGIGATELIIILVLALIIFGPGKLPEVGKAIGRGIREFKKATSAAVDDEDEKPKIANTVEAQAVRKDDVASST